MARIKIKDLPKDAKISKEQLKEVLGGLLRSSYESSVLEKGYYTLRSRGFVKLDWESAPAPVCTSLPG